MGTNHIHAPSHLICQYTFQMIYQYIHAPSPSHLILSVYVTFHIHSPSIKIRMDGYAHLN